MREEQNQSAQPLIRISVRNLVEFILRSGDIDNRGTGMEKDAMLMGGRLHRKIQRSMGAGYRSEVALKKTFSCKGFDLCVEGRADGIIEEDDGIVIDEIKGMLRPMETIREPLPVHLSQAKCYAYFYAEDHRLDEITVQMTYSHLETEEIRRFREVFTREELGMWFASVIAEYEKWAGYKTKWAKQRNESIGRLTFPFTYREGQKELVKSVYRTVMREKTLFIQAPTGVGKTMATLFPAVKAIGEDLAEKIFYLTAKTITRTVALDNFEVLKEQDLQLKVLVLTAKEKICFQETCNCNPDACPYAKGHFDRVNDAVYELLTESHQMNREMVEEKARKWQVCPFEMSLDVAEWVDAIVCDYNYVFDPTARLKRFFQEGEKGKYIFLVDEAHNLVERGRDMYSASICKEHVLETKRLLKKRFSKLDKILGECNRELLAYKRECGDHQVVEPPEILYWKLLRLLAETEKVLKEEHDENTRKALLDFYFEVRQFMLVYESLDDKYICYSHLRENGEFYLHLFCVDPSGNLQACMDRGRSTVLFSATLLPIHYYKELLSTGKENYAIYAESFFDDRRRKILLGRDISSKYTERGAELYQRYAQYLVKMIGGQTGNYLAFFPSYRFLESVREAFEDLICREDAAESLTILVQGQSMREEEREHFLRAFEEKRDGSLIGFCVMGGIFSEGIDLTNDKLIGVAIAGAGLPQVGCERELLREYFEERTGNGFDYAYLYPGINKVLQSAGRVIRTEEDRGVILLLDYRFAERRYRACFPREWENLELCNIGTVGEKLEHFWKEV